MGCRPPAPSPARAVNVRAGGHTRAAAGFHAVVLLAVVFFATPVVALVPTSALAGVIVLTAVRMIDLRTARSILRATRADGTVFLVTGAVTIVFDLVVAVQAGVAVAAFLALRVRAQNSGLDRVGVPDELDAEEEDGLLHEHIAVYRFHGASFFGGTKQFLDEIAQVNDVKVIIQALTEIR